MVHATAEASGRFRQLWSDWELDAACRFTPVPQREHFRLLMHGKQIPAIAFTDRTGGFREEAFRQLRVSGASVAFGNFENFSNAALALSRALEAEFRVPVQVNVYATPGGRQGLGAHVDPHDVLILQIQGDKEWDIYPEAAGAPAGAPITVTLKPGGWLFLPKGTRHEVRNRGVEASVHYTVGFHPLTWGEVFQRALSSARVATPAMNDTLPFGAALTDTPADRDRRLKAISSFVELPEFFSSYYANFPALMVPVPPADLIERYVLDGVNDSTRFRWREEAVLARNADGNPQVNLGYRRFPIELRHGCADMLTWMQGAADFRPGQLPMEDKGVALLLCRFLAGLGVLRIAPVA